MSLDRTDKEILRLLQKDATLSVGEIADKVPVSKTACWRRIQNLLADGIIEKRVALLNQEKVNLPLTAYISVRTNRHNQQWAKTFHKIVAQIPEILEVYRMSGDLDYLIKATVTDMPGYDRLYQKLIKADIFDVSSSFVMERMKYTTELPLGQA